ncbi:hypothetical protein [Vreelandella aquamarina]|uniref:hypothetical protein n=1 Tax=Vreelandella aquamarina TaxID=77097 RepID=UPI001D19679E|nr:hypothetical protein [Halomonas meridiana]MCC4287286.1 hypothetical protein [Halomonas meridiana]
MFFKKIFLKSKAATLVQNLLELRSEEGVFSGNPQKVATSLVQKAWDDRQSSLKQFTPQEITLAAAGLIAGIRGENYTDPNVNEMLYALVLVVNEVSSNKNKYDSCFHAHDHLIIEEAIELIESS